MLIDQLEDNLESYIERDEYDTVLMKAILHMPCLHLFYARKRLFRSMREDLGDLFKRVQDLNVKQEEENEVR